MVDTFILSQVIKMNCLILIFLAFLKCYRIKVQKDIPHLIWPLIFLIGAQLWIILNILSETSSIIFLRKISIVSIFLCFISAFIFIDFLTRNSPNILKLSVIVIMETLGFWYLFFPNTYKVETIGDSIYIEIIGPTRIIIDIILILFLLNLFYWLKEVQMNKVEILKKYWKRLFLSNSIFVSLIVVLKFQLSLEYFPVEIIIFTTECLIVIYLLNKFTELLFINPHRLYSLNVIDSKSGLLLYEYNWEELPTNTNISAAVVRSIKAILNISLEQNTLKKIELDEGSLIICDLKSIMVVLFASGSSWSIQSSLKKFTNYFFERFKDDLEKRVSHSYLFEEAEDILKNYFRLGSNK